MIGSAHFTLQKLIARTDSRRSVRSVLRAFVLPALVAMTALSASSFARAQQLFIGDADDNSVKRVDLQRVTASAFVEPKSAGLNGPMGMIFSDGLLYVVNQNVGTNQNGEVLKFDGTTGTFVGKLVASTDKNAPFAPRGIVRGPDRNFYVASLLSRPGKCSDAGSVNVYSPSGAFLYSITPDPGALRDAFRPRGVVFGTDGTLYVSSVGCQEPKDPNYDPVAGYVFTFGPGTVNGKLKFNKMLASNATVPELHRPEGLVPDNAGNLWITSFRSLPDPDRLLRINGKTGRLIDKIDLYQSPDARVYAQAVIFGPGGDLFAPVAGGAKPGEVLRCSIPTRSCSPFLATGQGLLSGWYAIFRTSDPTTLQYHE